MKVTALRLAPALQALAALLLARVDATAQFASIESAGSDRDGAADRFLQMSASNTLEDSASAVLAEAALAIRETVERSR